MRRLKQELEKTKKELDELAEQKVLINEELKRIRIEY